MDTDDIARALTAVTRTATNLGLPTNEVTIIEVSERYSGVDQDLLHVCQRLVLGMVAG